MIVLGLVLLARVRDRGDARPSASRPASATGTSVPCERSSSSGTYELGVGDFTLELADTALPAGTTHIEASVGIGELVVTVPDDAAVVIDAHTGLGRIDVLGHEDDGAGVHERVVAPGATADSPVLELDADVAVGNLEVRRE